MILITFCLNAINQIINPQYLYTVIASLAPRTISTPPNPSLSLFLSFAFTFIINPSFNPLNISVQNPPNQAVFVSFYTLLPSSTHRFFLCQYYLKVIVFLKLSVYFTHIHTHTTHTCTNTHTNTRARARSSIRTHAYTYIRTHV